MRAHEWKDVACRLRAAPVSLQYTAFNIELSNISARRVVKERKYSAHLVLSREDEVVLNVIH